MSKTETNKTESKNKRLKGEEGKCVCGRKGIRDARGHATCSHCYKIQQKYRGMQVSRAVKERHYFVDDNYDIRRGDKTLLDAALRAWETKRAIGKN